MIIYRPQRGSLHDAMLEKKEFKTVDEMKQYIEDSDPFDPKMYKKEDIVIYGDPHNDDRNGWRDTRYVCVKGYTQFDGTYVDYMEKYNVPQCIGMCATDYENSE